MSGMLHPITHGGTWFTPGTSNAVIYLNIIKQARTRGYTLGVCDMVVVEAALVKEAWIWCGRGEPLADDIYAHMEPMLETLAEDALDYLRFFVPAGWHLKWKLTPGDRSVWAFGLWKD